MQTSPSGTGSGIPSLGRSWVCQSRQAAPSDCELRKVLMSQKEPHRQWQTAGLSRVVSTRLLNAGSSFTRQLKQLSCIKNLSVQHSGQVLKSRAAESEHQSKTCYSFWSTDTSVITSQSALHTCSNDAPFPADPSTTSGTAPLISVGSSWLGLAAPFNS